MAWQNQKVAWGGKRSPWGLVIGGASNAIDRLSYDVSYECQDVSGTNWPSADTGPTLTTASAATTGQSTSGWSGLPARMVDEGVDPGTEGYDTTTFDWSDSDFHMRLLVDPNSPTSGSWFMRYVVSGTRLAEIRQIGANMTFTVRNDASGGIYTGTASGIPTTAMLIDWVVSGASMSIFINGTDHSPADHTGAVSFHNGPDTIELMGLGGGSPANGVYVFYGWRFGQTITLGDHQTDSTDLGL